MTYQEILDGARICNINIDSKLVSLNRIIFLIDHITRPEDYPVLRDKATALENEINAQIDELIKLREKAGYIIKSLPLEEMVVFEQYYINSLDWDAVAEKTHFSIRKVYNLRKSGMTILRNIYEDDKTHCTPCTCP